MIHLPQSFNILSVAHRCSLAGGAMVLYVIDILI
jgi:hypothetical protein